MAIGEIGIVVNGQGLHEFTDQVDEWLVGQGVDEGLCTLFIQHTSASLLIQENADPSARVDLENGLNWLVPENDSLYTHTQEGPDDISPKDLCEVYKKSPLLWYLKYAK